MSSLQGQVALVTGGGRGIGRGIALALARAGADVAISDIGPLQSTADEIAALGRRGLAVRADVRSRDQVRRMVDETVSRLGGLRLLVCAAGVISMSPVEVMTEEDWDLTLDVNIKGTFLTCQAAIPALKAGGGGCIITTASVAGKNGQPGLAHYCASKFAVVGFTNALAKELARDNIRVNAICPGIVRTHMWEYLAEMRKLPGESKEQAWQRIIEARVPLGRPQTPEDMGQLAVYLASAVNVTGQAINVDGGSELH